MSACWTRAGRSWPRRDDLLNGEVTGEIELGRAGGAVVDLHWSLVLSETLRRRFHIPTVDILARSTPLTIGPVDARTLDTTDTLVHLCHHAALSGAVRLVHLLDVDQAARRIEDWERVARRARSWGAGAQVGLVLARARRVLGTPVPQEPRPPARPLPRVRDPGVRGRPRVAHAAARAEASWPRLVARAARPSASATAFQGAAERRARGAEPGAAGRGRRAADAGRARRRPGLLLGRRGRCRHRPTRRAERLAQTAVPRLAPAVAVSPVARSTSAAMSSGNGGPHGSTAA